MCQFLSKVDADEQPKKAEKAKADNNPTENGNFNQEIYSKESDFLDSSDENTTETKPIE